MSIEEKYDEVRQLIAVGKEKGYLLYDEVNEMLPSEITSSEDLDELFNAFGSAGIEVVDSDKAYRGDKDFDRDGSGDEPELDLTPGALTVVPAAPQLPDAVFQGQRRRLRLACHTRDQLGLHHV